MTIESIKQNSIDFYHKTERAVKKECSLLKRNFNHLSTAQQCLVIGLAVLGNVFTLPLSPLFFAASAVGGYALRKTGYLEKQKLTQQVCELWQNKLAFRAGITASATLVTVLFAVPLFPLAMPIATGAYCGFKLAPDQKSLVKAHLA